MEEDLDCLDLPAPGGAGGGRRVEVSTLSLSPLGRSVAVLDGVRGGGAAGFAAAAEPGCLGGLRGSPELCDRSLSCLCTGAVGCGGFAAGEAALGLRGSLELRERSLPYRTGGGFGGGEYGLTAGGRGGRSGPGGPDELLGSVSERPLRDRSLSTFALAFIGGMKGLGGGISGLTGGARTLLERDLSAFVSVRLCFSGMVGLSQSMSVSLSLASMR